MWKAVLTEPERFVLEDAPIPAPGPDEVILEVKRSGICGSDLHIFHGQSSIQPPVVLGHEFAGTVYALGDDVAVVAVGDACVVEPGVPCGHCTYCLSGRYNLCASQYTIGGYREHDGAYAQYVRVPSANLIPMPPGMSFDVGAMVEPVACAMHALDLAQVREGDTVLIIGAGTIGLLIAQAVRMAGAETACVSDIVPERLTLARELGVDATIDVREADPVAWSQDTYGEGGIRVVIDTATTPRTFSQAQEIVRRGGRILNVGVATEPVEWQPNSLWREFELTGMNMYTRRNFDEARCAIEGRAIQVEPLISAVYPLLSINDAYEAIQSRPGDLIKVLLAPND
ncbi:MAG: alcohol dehydrogenase catalytic domain-containing protein [Chloroflexi bacterium]|nr:alcohol dehydrogenase catalytic domain-containing protein [Chloroflexota bacterium]